jgi:hypothetical protein
LEAELSQIRAERFNHQIGVHPRKECSGTGSGPAD